MLVSFNIVKGEDCAIPWRQLRDGFVEGNAVDNRHCVGVLRAFNYLDRGLAILGGLFHLDSAFAEVHQDLIYSQPMQPGSEGRLATKASNFSKELNEDLLCQVLGLRDIPSHA